MKVTFLVEVKTAIGQVLNLGLVSWGVAPVTPFEGCSFSLLTRHLVQTAGIKLAAGQSWSFSYTACLSKNAQFTFSFSETLTQIC